MSSTTTLSPLERLISILRTDKRRSTDLSPFGAAIYMELFRFAKEYPHLGIRKDAHFADYIQLNRDNFSHYLSGHREPDPKTAEYICDMLKCSYDRKVEIMALIQQSPLRHRQLAEQKLNEDLIPFLSALENQPTTSALSLATSVELPAIKAFSPVLLEETQTIPPTTEPLTIASPPKTRSLRGAQLASVEFPMRWGGPTLSKV